MSNTPVRDVPLSLKIVIAVITILTAFNTYINSFTDRVDENEKARTITAEQVSSINSNITTMNRKLDQALVTTAENKGDIRALESDIQNLRQNQRDLNTDIRDVIKKIDKMYELVLRSYEPNEGN